VFGRRRRTQTGRVKVTFSVTSDVVPGPFAEYPSREPGAAAVHEQVYETQREELNEMLVATGQLGGVFIAKVRAVRRPDGGEHTVTFWTKGVHTLLPAADAIVLVELPEEEGVEPITTSVRWDVTAAICADNCWEVMPDFKPPRVRTKAWPSDEQLVELKRRQIP
jgi:hypothetical protein